VQAAVAVVCKPAQMRARLAARRRSVTGSGVRAHAVNTIPIIAILPAEFIAAAKEKRATLTQKLQVRQITGYALTGPAAAFA
jgi:hypothetical protein